MLKGFSNSGISQNVPSFHSSSSIIQPLLSLVSPSLPLAVTNPKILSFFSSNSGLSRPKLGTNTVHIMTIHDISFQGLLRVIAGLLTIPSYTEALPGQHGSCRKSSQDVAGFSGLSGSRCGFGSLGVGFQIFWPFGDSYRQKKTSTFFVANLRGRFANRSLH